jgi:DNA (cytosine-5)-methyltransferase 1
VKFVDLFAGMGGFHRALTSLGHDCVYACELDDELRGLYALNYPSAAECTFGGLRASIDKVPHHDILCAGFPCQPFSKSGSQDGVLDGTRGTLFYDVLRILDRHRPEYVFLENVGNFERHDGGHTWRIVRRSLAKLGYDVQATTHMASGGSGLLSPHHFGYPHNRERFFVVGRLTPWDRNVLPARRKSSAPSLKSITQTADELTLADSDETRLSSLQERCIDHWNEFLQYLPSETRLPSFPLWGDELDAHYPFEQLVPARLRKSDLVKACRYRGSGSLTTTELLARLPSYAREAGPRFPAWKVRFIRQNRDVWTASRRYLPLEWRARMRSMPPSLRKFEWNCQGERRDLWDHVMQFRPSGLRVKRMTASPALVAMTTTQIPILGPEHRFITRREGLRLQGFPDDHVLPLSRAAAFQALGNAVHVDLVRLIAASALLAVGQDTGEQLLAV